MTGAAFRDVEDELGEFFATGAGPVLAGVSWRGTTAGGLWPGQTRPAVANGVPGTALFLYTLGEDPVQLYSNHLHTGVVRLLARAADPSDEATAMAMLKACAEYGHNRKPTGYADLRHIRGPVRLPASGANERLVAYCDFRYGYQEP